MNSEDRRTAPQATTAEVGQAPRRRYTKPALTVYGPLAKLTRSTSSGTGEATPQGAMKMMCL